MGAIAERIMQAMKTTGTTYVDLAKRTGVSKSALQRYATGETEKIPLDRVEMIASALNVSPEYLLGWTDNVGDTFSFLVLGQSASSIFRQFKYVTDEIKSLSDIDLPQDAISTYHTSQAMQKIMEINDAILHAPRVALAIDLPEAVIGLKFILCYLNYDWRKYDDEVFEKIINGNLFKDLIKNLLSMYQKQERD